MSVFTSQARVVCRPGPIVSCGFMSAHLPFRVSMASSPRLLHSLLLRAKRLHHHYHGHVALFPVFTIETLTEDSITLLLGWSMEGKSCSHCCHHKWYEGHIIKQ